MKRVLIIKMSSMGDVIHTLPALTDVSNIYPNIIFDWIVEPGFAEVPRWHKSVNTVIEAPLRRLRKTPWQALQSGEWIKLISAIRHTTYDAIIDAQGLIKSALVAQFAKGPVWGFDRKSVRDPVASLLYRNKVNVEKQQHAVEKVRQLFAKIFQYEVNTLPDYGIDKNRLVNISYGDNTVIFLHGTTWTTKHWPASYWCQLAAKVSSQGFQVLLPWGNDVENQRAKLIRQYCEQKHCGLLPIVLPKLCLGEITSLIAKAKGIVAVDTGLGHIAAAMAVPTVSLYGSTDPRLTGAYGPLQYHLKVDASCSPCLSRECKKGTQFAINPPCFESLPPEKVWQALSGAMKVTPPYQSDLEKI
ncbi:MAG: lipopolysaccharide heptosyltransferase I [Proteobacteria bacterium]|nr:lipopolysaccharide heptosyltransferase I [Pseudomonadota bacterium]